MIENVYLDDLKEAKFSTIPGMGNREEVDFKGQTLYTSKPLKENVKKVSKKYMPNNVSKIVIKLVDDGKIIPVFKSKSIIDYIFRQRKKLKNHSLATTLNGKVYIFIETMYSILKLSSINEKTLSKIILHEIIHMAEHIKPKRFFSINYKYYIEFYKEFFSTYLYVKEVKDVIVIDILKRMTALRKKGIVNFYKIYHPTFQSLQKDSDIDQKEFTEAFDIFINFLDDMYSGFVKNVDGHIWEASQAAYLKLAGGNSETIGQEFWSPSEIICVISEINSKHPSIINSIKLLK